MTKSSNSRKFSKGHQKKYENAYIIFSDFFRKTFSGELNGRNVLKEAGKFWHFLPNEMKNQFTEYANRKRILKKIGEGYTISEINVERENSTLCIIYDDRINSSHNSTRELNRAPNILPKPRSLSTDDEYEKLFSNFINYE